MGKKHKRLAENRNAKKSNRPANPTPTESQPTTLPATTKKPLWRRGVVLISSLIAVLGLFGYEALWPKVIIDPSAAVDSGILSYEFTFANQACYPIKVDRIDLYVIKLSWPNLSWAFSSRNWPNDIGSMQGIGFRYDYKQVKIGGRNSIAMKLNPEFAFEGYPVGKLKDGSKMAIKITYRLPLLRLQKTDCQFFESGQDIGGNPVWLKKPMENLGGETNYSIFYWQGTNEVH